MKIKITSQVTFNTYKHHLGFLAEQIDNWRNKDWVEIINDLNLIGENLIDLYTGKLTTEDIIKECITYLNRNNACTKTDFLNWLKPMAYRKTEISDGTIWIIREGKNPVKYIHIHPAKYSVNTTRIRATTLKTVLALMIESIPVSGNMQSDLAAVNSVRTKNLQLSPVKSLDHRQGILKFWKFFTKYRQCYF